jgi:hypothetical protein
VKLKKALVWTTSATVVLFLALIISPFGHLLVIVGGSNDIRYEIPQNIGGTLIVVGEQWMDVKSFGDITEIRFKPSGSVQENTVGASDYCRLTIKCHTLQKSIILFLVIHILRTALQP